MSRAYCLTCNEQVMVTTSGTCPSGHQVEARHEGPEPWVGTAGEQEPAPTGRQQLDVADLQELQVAGVMAGDGTAASNGHAATNGHAPTNGHTVAAEPPADDLPPAPPVQRARANSQASDDLAAMLAEALQSSDADPVAPTPTPAAAAEPAPAEPAPAEGAPFEPAREAAEASPDVAVWDEDVDDLAALAAELQLDTSLPTDAEEEAAGPTPAPEGAHETWPSPDEDVTWPSDVADVTDEDLPSPEPVAEPVVDEAPPPPAEVEDEESPASVDLTNFTARGARVGGAGSSPRRLFGRRR